MACDIVFQGAMDKVTVIIDTDRMKNYMKHHRDTQIKKYYAGEKDILMRQQGKKLTKSRKMLQNMLKKETKRHKVLLIVIKT